MLLSISFSNHNHDSSRFYIFETPLANRDVVDNKYINPHSLSGLFSPLLYCNYTSVVLVRYYLVAYHVTWTDDILAP